MPGSKRLTLKTIKNRENVHPYSRKARQISRVYMRKEKLEKKSNERSNNPKAERWLWFRFAFDESLSFATKADIHDLIDMYLKRNDEELQKLREERESSSFKRPKSSRENLLEALIQSERAEYVSGFELPDLTNGKNVKLLREWDGDQNGMSRIKTIRVTEASTDIEKKKTKSKSKSGVAAMDVEQ
ncbi:translation machinery-associated protein 16 [Apophysomyces ossiformis]|uniref:Translation machinery-associated protein 16 n=1 Tax=Apophysomyces ossiformis TaxID=679940 RepID=A0A8H7BX53_9FUNG|nr:translation machinery-associated protein 16 [Apophysomyces ossiformis]